MRFNTHNRTPRIKYPKSVRIALFISCGFLITTLLLIAVTCSIIAKSIMPAIVVLTLMLLLAMFFTITQKDMNNAYIEVSDGIITVVDYYLGIKKEKIFSMQDIGSAEILRSSSLKVRGYSYNIAGISYIVFRDSNGKYIFKIIYVPETKVFFGAYLEH